MVLNLQNCFMTKTLQAMSDSQKLLGKEKKILRKIISHIWSYNRKCQRKSNIIKIFEKFIFLLHIISYLHLLYQKIYYKNSIWAQKLLLLSFTKIEWIFTILFTKVFQFVVIQEKWYIQFIKKI